MPLRKLASRSDVATRITTRLAQRIDAVRQDRTDNAASIDAIQAAGNVAQLRTQVVRMQREMDRMRRALLDHDRLLMLSTGLDDGSTGDDPNA